MNDDELRGLVPIVIGILERRGADFSAAEAEAASTSADDTVDLYFLCAHPDLSPASAVALTLRAVGGLATRQIAEAYLVPEATMAQRISRAKRTLSGRRLDRPGNVSAVLKVLYLVFNEGYSGDVGEADGPELGLAELGRLDRSLPRYFAVEAHLRERAGKTEAAAKLYALAADRAADLAERKHLIRQAARLNSRSASAGCVPWPRS